MQWEIVIHGEQGYAEVVTNGVADKDGSLLMVRALAQAMQSHGLTKVLIDHRKIERVVGTTLDIYDRPSAFPAMGQTLQISIAELIRPEHWDHFRFFETVCRNRGFQVSVFMDQEEALAWLLA